MNWKAGLALCALSWLPACGGGNQPANGPTAASLEGDRGSSGSGSAAVELPGAPTEAHKRLSSLLPLAALKRDSVLFAGWDGMAADLSAEEPAKAAMPVVKAEYHSMGYRIVTDGASNSIEAEQDYPQRCTLVLIEAPDAVAAEVVARGIREKLKARAFEARDPLAIAGSGEKSPPTVERYLRIDAQGEVDNVFVTYLKVVDSTVIYAMETEAAKRADVAGGSTARVTDDQRGSRLGGQLLSLVHHRLAGR
ncbi:MAG: hypothetical protein IT463_14570 [Planctomycetes bacterium]|nr:hypothetical protein [Planctomycetota bacterium]